MLDTQTFAAWALDAGFAKVGFCLPDRFVLSEQIVKTQEPLSERKQLSFSPLDNLPETKSLAVLLWPYTPAPSPRMGEVFVDSYYAASNAAYHAAKMLETRLLNADCYAKANVAYPAKEAAVRANMGVIGKNSLLITPEYGSRVVIILMATGIEAPQSADFPSSCKSCIECGRCIQACPSGALDENGLSHPERCLRNFMMEGVVVPEDLRAKFGMRLIGCDICQRVCPMQKCTVSKSDNVYTLSEFVTEDPAAFSSAAAHLADEIGRNTARPQRIRAQAALLAGNSRDSRYLPVLRNWAQLPFEAVREHARWAIRQIEMENENT